MKYLYGALTGAGVMLGATIFDLALLGIDPSPRVALSLLGAAGVGALMGALWVLRTPRKP